MGTIPGTDGGTADSGQPIASELVGNIEGVPEQGRWLVEKLWLDSGVGIVGGTPKTGKTWFALEFAVSVASGQAMFGQFEVPQAGPVVVFPAEDDPRAIRDRVAGLCAHKGVELSSLPLHIITSRVVRLDEPEDRKGFSGLLERLKPRLVVLDPLVRLHGGDENYAGHIAELLGFLRGLQREHGCAIMLTHHVSKKRTKGGQLGQALRGSGELHAWGDSNVYLTRKDGGVVRVELEHRAAAAPEPVHVAMRVEEAGTWFEFVEEDELEDVAAKSEPSQAKAVKLIRARKAPSTSGPLKEQVLAVLAGVGEPVSQSELRRVLRVRNQRLTEVLRELEAQGLIERPGGRRWALTKDGGDA